ncbi:MAG: type II toxin-antitoxin system HipA family toxin [Methylococcales bacterium]|nr:type II toxin-antitoxin system HipA family toxin [Methylococcales bacterium]
MQRLTVYAGNRLVGHLSAGDATGMTFVYTQSWLENEAATPLSPDMPLSGQTFQGERVRSFFENLLPEGDVLNFISQAVHISPTNIFGLLERFGGDTAGAFSLLPEGMRPSDGPHYLPVKTDAILQWFDRSRGIPLDITGEQARMSLSGAQDKMTVLIDSTGALSIPLGSSPSSHIIKPSISHRGDVPNTAINEAMIMMLARAVGLDVAEVRYAPELGAVIVTRYDREVGQNGLLHRLHQNDLCQVLGIPSSKKYESEGGPSLQTCFKAVIERSAQPALAKKRLIEWVVFNVLTGNMDSHAKNLSLMTIGGSTKLAPFYDLVCTAVYPNLSQKFAFKIGGENRPRWMMSRHWDRFAIETDTKPQFVSKVMADLIKRTESALPNVVEKLQPLTVKPDEQLMMGTIEKYIQHSLLQMKSRLNDKTSESSSNKDQ